MRPDTVNLSRSKWNRENVECDVPCCWFHRVVITIVLLEPHDILPSGILLVDASTLRNIARLYDEKEYSDYGKCCEGAHSKMLIRNAAELNLHGMP